MRTRLPITAGVSLKPEYFDEALATADSELFFEIHPENYFIDGGPRLRGLQAIAERHAVSLHGIGASLGGVDPVPIEHLDSLKHLAEMLEPASILEHAAWSAAWAWGGASHRSNALAAVEGGEIRAAGVLFGG